MKTLELLSVESCREVLRQFWDEQTDVAETTRGIALALPLLYPDGWQVQVFIEPVTPEWALVSDRGRTLGRLLEQGVNLDAGQTGVLLEEWLQTWELQREGLELRREIPLPLEGLDVQLFAEALVSIAHLVYRRESYALSENQAERTLQQVFKERHLEPQKNVELEGVIEKRIRVDYLIERVRQVAWHVVRRRTQLLPYMEQWGFRWGDLHRRNPRLVRAMVYDPDKQEWDETSLRIGNEVCELFCPYFETDRLHDFLERITKGCDG